MKTEVEGIVIRERELGENAKLLTILTAEKGVVSTISRGSKTLRAGKSIIQPLAYCRFALFEGKSGYLVNETQIIKVFFELRNNLNTLSLAQYFCELTWSLLPEKNVSGDFLKLLLNSLFYLTDKSKDIAVIKSIFELRACALCGYMPDLTACKNCGTYESYRMRFLINKGTIVCEKCDAFSPVSKDYVLAPGLLRCLRHIIYSSPEKLFSFSLSKEAVQLLSEICESYVFAHVKDKFMSLDFYKNIENM